MNPSEVDQLLSKALDTFGIESQENMMIEECSELIQALCKFRRVSHGIDFDRATIENVREELADVYIMWQQMEKVFNTSDNDIGKRYIKKMDRLKERLEPCQNVPSQNTTVTNV